MCACSFKVGDLVDWILLREDGKPYKSQPRKWHGEIVDEWNTNREGHWFVVRWDSSNKAGAYDGPATDINPSFIPHSPHYFQSRCNELNSCGVGNLHPKDNRLPKRTPARSGSETS